MCNRNYQSRQATLITEQKTTKIIQILEDFRVDLPNAKNRIDPEVEDMKIETNPHEVLNAIDISHAKKVL
ncbi:MAG: hypothetical protein ACXWJK_00325 [Burkholderiaceae bacterium]